MQSRVARWTAFLATTGIAVALWIGAKPSSGGGWHVGFGTAAVVGSVAALALLAWASFDRSGSVKPPGQAIARIDATDSPDWSIQGTYVAGDRPFIKAKRSPRWKIKNTVLDGEDADG